LTLSFSM